MHAESVDLHIWTDNYLDTSLAGVITISSGPALHCIWDSAVSGGWRQLILIVRPFHMD